MEFQDFIQKMPDALLSKQGLEFKRTMTRWFPDESAAIREELYSGETGATQEYTGHKADKADVPTWSKK